MKTFDSISNSRRMRFARGFTLLETVVVIAVIMVLISLLLPAIQQSRDTARNLVCRNNLTQLGVALSHYARGHGCLPPGAVGHPGKTPEEEDEDRLSWIAQILPYLDQGPLYAQVNHSLPDVGPDPLIEMAKAADMSSFAEGRFSDGSSRNLAIPPDIEAETAVDETPPVWTFHLSVLYCPSSWVGRGTLGSPAGTHYAGCHSGTAVPISDDNSGLLYLNSSQSLEEIPDGHSQTILVGEVYPVLVSRTWMSGTRSTLRNTGVPIATMGTRMSSNGKWAPPSTGNDTETDFLSANRQLREKDQGFDGPHFQHINFLFADGSVRPIRRNVDPQVYSWLGSRNDLQSVPPDF